MKLIDACGFELDLAMFNDKITIEDISNDIHNLVFNKYYLTCQVDFDKRKD